MGANAYEELLALARGVIVVGFDGPELSREASIRFGESEFAGYVLFARNVVDLAQVRALTDSLRGLPTSPPPIIAIDQEGGRVARLRSGAQIMPPMMSLGAVGDAALAREAGASIAFDLRRAGCNVNFAPVLDLAADPRSSVIGARAFADDPDMVADLASAFAQGLRDGGIVPTYKHFPGHGSTADDSHLMLPVIEMDERTLRARDLLPFLRLVPRAQAVMTAHILVRAIDPLNPATLSHRILTGILREECGFEGVCFTDCMQMDAIARGVGTVAGVTAAIAAGADCALISHDATLALESADALARAVQSGRLARERLEEAYRRVQILRASLSEPLALTASPPYPNAGRTIARRAITCVRGEVGADATSSIVVSFQSRTTQGAQGTLDEHPALRAPGVDLPQTILPLEPDANEIDSALATVAASGRRPIVLARRAHLNAGQARAIAMLLHAQPDALVVSLHEPFDVAAFPQARNVVAAYGDDRASIDGLGDVIFGMQPALGKLPVRLA